MGRPRPAPDAGKAPNFVPKGRNARLSWPGSCNGPLTEALARGQAEYIPGVMKAVFPALDGFGLAAAPPSLSAKRALDLAIAWLAVLCCPVLALMTLAIALDSRGPVLFRQRRTGERQDFRHLQIPLHACAGRRRRCGAGHRGRCPHHPRRPIPARSSLDELPQLFNVLAGEMSLVGPRPHAVAHDELLCRPHRQLRACAIWSSRASPAGPR